MYLFLFWYFGLSIDFLFYAIIILFIIITFIDIEYMEIPDVLVLSILGTSIVHKLVNYFIFDKNFEIWSSILGLLVSGFIFLIIIVASKGGMGGGDMTLIASLGFVLGLKKIMLTIFLSFVLASIISIFLLITKLKTRKDPIPFGPFIVLAFIIVLFFGERILLWYSYR